MYILTCKINYLHKYLKLFNYFVHCIRVANNFGFLYINATGDLKKLFLFIKISIYCIF